MTRAKRPLPRRRNSAPIPRPGLILASASPRRASLLRQLGQRFSVATRPVSEVAPAFLSPAETALVNASRKAVEVARLHPDSIVLGADTVVSLDGRHFGKPLSLEEAESMLRQLQGRVHQVATGMCLVHWERGWRRLIAETTAVTFRSLSSAEIRRYLRATNPLDKAGGYGIQDQGQAIIQSIQGSYSNVVGLPLERLKQELAVLSTIK